MKYFIKLYRVGVQIKLKASLYSVAILFFIGICNFVYLDTSMISIWVLVEVFAISMIVSSIEQICIPYDLNPYKRNVISWEILANLVLISSSYLFKWFDGVPSYVYVLLIVILEGGLIASRIGMNILKNIDTKNLNHQLRIYQDKRPN